MKKILSAAAGLLLAATAAQGDEAPAASAGQASLLGYSHFPQQDGESLYNAVCAACHMPDAEGGTGAGFYPALANNTNLADWGYPVMMVMNGSKAMPGFHTALDDKQIVAIVTYIRTHFGNEYTDEVPLEEVTALRGAQ